ncbi:TPA: hypothetical protein N0H42_005986 [Pseudomonas aeruginosa]|uniref:hypothetical protein n=1 Tax=Pseudomonas aeruginosa TaxID=287 RepID=UPI0003B9E9AB|nr:hypothetical protein [Pseudomonas aeruginosa]ELK4796919.1 hypothetical protein [Pseudomonas aeruginosa]ELK4828804.1 hypothetical protein [Pseudomonas aeruginosa]ELK4832672.1 hypothetical protein [Pseudomonas aeruginosa]ELP2750904.1 hypothetical protein [Pseudomonas aeruginosa]ERU95522.1 hypothetical protein Q081_03649 [Pseudomonas aeruginosa M8A.2]
MSHRHEFSEATKSSLAKRAGNSCSFPGCYAVTEGPSSESETSFSKTGMACHIYAAANGPSARRVDTDLSGEELSHISNGIWMCYTHGKLIDTDESTYTPDELKTWRTVAERRAQIWQQLGRNFELHPRSFIEIPLPQSKIDLKLLGQENQIIGDALSRACVSEIWGKNESNAIRDALIELTRNAFYHGNASSVSISIHPKSITLTDDGAEYNPINILNEEKPGGGSFSINELINQHGNSIFFTHHYNSKNNHCVFSAISNSCDIKNLTPCYIEIPPTYGGESKITFEVAEFCKTVYILLPSYFVISDALKLPTFIKRHLQKDKHYIFIGENLSKRTFEVIVDKIGDYEIVELG